MLKLSQQLICLHKEYIKIHSTFDGESKNKNYALRKQELSFEMHVDVCTATNPASGALPEGYELHCLTGLTYSSISHVESQI